MQRKTMAKLTIIILNFNTKDLTLRAIQSCLALAYKEISVVVVDNASSDGSVQAFEILEKKESRLQVISLSENNGFAAGNNVALKNATSDYVMLLNSDAYFPENSDIETVLNFLDQSRDIGVLTPFVKLTSGSIDPACHRGFPTPWRAFTYYAGLEKIGILKRLFGGYHQTWKDLNVTHEIDACSGAAMIVRTSAMENIGFLDEQFFMYGEDLDWCFRFQKLHWKIVFYPTLSVIHDKHTSGLKKEDTSQSPESRSQRQDDSELIRKRTKNAFYDAMKLFYKKHDMGSAWSEQFVLLGIWIISKLK